MKLSLEREINLRAAQELLTHLIEARDTAKAMAEKSYGDSGQRLAWLSQAERFGRTIARATTIIPDPED